MEIKANITVDITAAVPIGEIYSEDRELDGCQEVFILHGETLDEIMENAQCHLHQSVPMKNIEHWNLEYSIKPMSKTPTRKFHLYKVRDYSGSGRPPVSGGGYLPHELCNIPLCVLVRQSNGC